MISESVMNFQRFHHYPALLETVCDSNDVLFSVSTDTDIACSAFCVQMNSCRSYMYNSGTGHCIGCSEKYTETSSMGIVAGYGYYEITTREHSIRRYLTRYSIPIVRPPVRGDNPRAFARELAYVQANKIWYNYFMSPLSV